jgi:hypothetical protein
MPHDEDERARRHVPRLPQRRRGVEHHLRRASAAPPRLVLVVLSVLAFAGPITGCASEPRPSPFFVTMAPPPEPVELQGSAPSPVYVWARGQYNYNGYEYVWTPGHWHERPHVRAVWIAGRWEKTHRGWTFVEGHWS